MNRCSGKYISGNQLIMGTFMEIQSHKQKQLLEEASKLEAEQLSAANKASLTFDMMEAHSQGSSTSPESTGQNQSTSRVS